MINAKDELISAIKDCGVIAATVTRGDWYQPEKKHFLLKEHYSKADWNDFWEKLNFEYDNGDGGQELFGTVWLADGTWLERGEYDGSEWWEHRALPKIPDKLKSSKSPGEA